MWHKHSDALGWSKGHEGKGYLLRNGVIRHWNVDPYNPEDHQTVHQRNLEISPIGLKFEVDPDGGIVTESPTPKVDSIVAADPRLYDAGQRPEGEFDLGEPKLKQEPGPDYNFINSKWDFKESGSWDPTTCENCGAPMGEPRLMGSRWVNSCTHCRMTRDVPTSNPLLKQWNQNWPPYPDLLQEVAQPRAWIRAAWEKRAQPSYPIANQVMYHVSPRRNRESILSEGLQGFDKGRREQSPWEYTWDQPPGNYLFDNPADAHDYIYNVHGRSHDLTKEPDFEDMYEWPEPPEDFHQWPEDEQEQWHDEAQPSERTEDFNGYDIHRVDARGLPIALDPEAAIAHPKEEPWDLGRLHDAYQKEREGYEGDGDYAPDTAQLHSDVGGYYGTEPRRYYVPQDIHPSRIQLEQHVPSWSLDEQGMYDHLDDTEREYPQPWAATPFTERPMPGHEGKTSDYQGWSNWDTWHTGLMTDNEREPYTQVRNIVEQGGGPQQLRDWVIPNVIGPYNKQQIADAREWNEIPQDERVDHNYERLKEESPEAADFVDQLGFGANVSDYQPPLMDPEMVNWDEIHHNILSEYPDDHPVHQHFNQPMTVPTEWTSSKHGSSPANELQEWLADMGEVDPPSIHHETDEDMALRPQVSPQEGLSYYPPGHVPDQYKQAHESFDERPYLPCPECGGPMEYTQDQLLDYNPHGPPVYLYSCHDCGHEVDDLPFTGNPDIDHHMYRGVYSKQSDILQPQPVPQNPQVQQPPQGPRDVQETVHTQLQEALQRGDTEMAQWLMQFYSPHQQLMGFPPMMASKEAAAPKFDPTQPMPTGLPRPFDEVPMTEQWGELGIRPVPWSQAGGIDGEAMSSGETRWGVPDTYRLEQAENNSFCLVCGEPVTDGAVFIDMVNDMTASKLKAQYTQADLPWVLDRGPLHTRCAALTAAHCPDIKKGLAGGQYVQKPYLAQMENPQGTIPVQSAKTADGDPIGDWESEGGTVGSTKTADSPINQADATNDPLGKPAVLEPSKKGDPDYLKDEACPHCQQVHRPDEPCPNSSVRQYQQQERKWYNYDPNVIHSKQAQSQVMYHVAPAEHEQTIATEGLQPNAPSGDYPQGVYLFPDRENAEFFADHMREHDLDEGSNNAERHVYEVNSEGLPLQQDPAVSDDDPFQAEYPTALRSYYTPEPIPSDRIRRVE